MTRLYISVAVIAGLAGCAASAPDMPVSDSGAVPVAVVSDEGETQGSDVIHVVEVPAVAKTGAEVVVPAHDELICHRERLTGTHRVERICRFKSDIDESRKATQRTLQEMTRGTSASANSN